jgi:V/A-type H+-transporting ATPase subunit D
MKVNLAATKTNLIKAKKTLSLTEEGHELLDEKRKILVQELATIAHIADRLERDVDKALRGAYELVDRACVVMGRKKLEELSYSIDIKSDLAISQRRIMGVSIPAITLKMSENPPYYSPHAVSFYVDEVIAKFKDILSLLAQLAEKKIALLRIADELQRTIRKVNALEKIYIPSYRDTVKYISDRLDEEGRDAFALLKLVKKGLRT